MSAGPVALVTGGARGIGLAVARALGAAGHRLVLADLDTGALKEAVSDLEGRGHEVLPLECDVSRAEAVEALVATIAERFGRLDVVVSNAGPASSGRRVADTGPEEVVELFAVHALGGFLVARACLPLLREAPRGSLVFVSSIAASAAAPNGAPYAMAKAAVEALAATLAKEEQRRGVRVNTVVAGFFDTRMGREIKQRIVGRDPSLDAVLPLNDPAQI